MSRTKGDGLYRLVDLYQYLAGVFADTLLVSKDGKRWAEAFNVDALHASITMLESDVLRTIALLGIVGRWHGMIPTQDVVSLAIMPVAAKSDAERAIQSLVTKSAIVHRKYNDTFSLWEGSDLDIEARIADAREDSFRSVRVPTYSYAFYATSTRSAATLVRTWNVTVFRGCAGCSIGGR